MNPEPHFRPWHRAICIRCINEKFTYNRYTCGRMAKCWFDNDIRRWLPRSILEFLDFSLNETYLHTGKNMQKRGIREAFCISCKPDANKHNLWTETKNNNDHKIIDLANQEDVFKKRSGERMNSLNVQRLISISVIKYETITRPASFIDQRISGLTYFNFLNY